MAWVEAWWVGRLADPGLDHRFAAAELVEADLGLRLLALAELGRFWKGVSCGSGGGARRYVPDPCESVLISALDVLATGAFRAWALPLSPVFAAPNERTTSASSCGGRADRRGCNDFGGDWSAWPGNACFATSTGDGSRIFPRRRAKRLHAPRSPCLSFWRVELGAVDSPPRLAHAVTDSPPASTACRATTSHASPLITSFGKGALAECSSPGLRSPRRAPTRRRPPLARLTASCPTARCRRPVLISQRCRLCCCKASLWSGRSRRPTLSTAGRCTCVSCTRSCSSRTCTGS